MQPRPTLGGSGSVPAFRARLIARQPGPHSSNQASITNPRPISTDRHDPYHHPTGLLHPPFALLRRNALSNCQPSRRLCGCPPPPPRPLRESGRTREINVWQSPVVDRSPGPGHHGPARTNAPPSPPPLSRSSTSDMRLGGPGCFTPPERAPFLGSNVQRPSSHV
ncbi:hypothetical protein LZ30DRAFT_458562 [Colletotrichum cereale]|nr:hypothetical protein LZ30DRAFT_458562 [Colletotrichum cereale]